MYYLVQKPCQTAAYKQPHAEKCLTVTWLAANELPEYFLLWSSADFHFAGATKVIEYATIQAAITHNTPDGINAALAAALMSHYFIYRLGRKRAKRKFLEGRVSGQWSQWWSGKVKSKGWMSVRAAITALERNHSMSELLKDCIAFTGDVDTVAAIALAAGSCSDEMAQDLPDHLIEDLENSAYGREYIIELDKQLMNYLKLITKSLKRQNYLHSHDGKFV